MREVEDDRCGGNMGKWKLVQNSTVRLSAAVPHLMRQCRIAAVPLQECGTAAPPGPARICIAKWLDFRVCVSGDFGLEFEHLVALLEQC